MGMAVHERTDGLAAKRAPYTPEAVADEVRPIGRVDLLAARYLNVTVAVIGLLITLPIMVLVAIVIKVTSRGPVLYTQTRVGLDNRRRNGSNNGSQLRRSDLGGRPFKIYKFRTMRVGAESQTGAVWATKDDPRVTVFGKLLRQYRLDELPQLFNVLRGDMNVVGPRPERPAIFAELRTAIPGYHRRQQALPGITGHAQINQEYDTSIESVRTKLAYDLEYIDRRGFWEDLRIMARTIPVIFLRRGGW